MTHDAARASTRSTWRTPVAAFVVVASFYLFKTIVSLEPSLATQAVSSFYGVGVSGFGILVSLFYWASAPMQIATGVLLDRIGSRSLLIPAMGVCILGVGLFALTPILWIGGLARLLNGLGGSVAYVTALYVLARRFPPERFAQLTGLLGAVAMIGTAIGSTVLSDVMDHLGWRIVFAATMVVGVAVFLGAAAFLEPDRPQPGAHGEGVPATLRVLVRSPRLWLLSVAGALYYVPVTVFAGLWGQQDLIKVDGLKPVAAETAVSMIFWGVAAGNVASGYLSDRLAHRRWIVLVGAALACAAFSLAIFVVDRSVVAVGATLLLAGFLCGPQVLIFVMVKEDHPKAIAGTVLAFANTIGVCGAIIFQPLVGWLLDATGNDDRLALAVIPAALAATVIVVAFVREVPPHASGDPVASPRRSNPGPSPTIDGQAGGDHTRIG